MLGLFQTVKQENRDRIVLLDFTHLQLRKQTTTFTMLFKNG